MNQDNWTKVLLSSYRHLPKIVGAIDKIFYAKALSSSIMSGAYLTINNTQNVVNNLMGLTQRKTTLLDLKGIIEKVLKNLKQEQSKILILKYVDNFTTQKIAELMNISERSYFRKAPAALKCASKMFEFYGCSSENLEKTLKSEQWLFEACEELEEKPKNDVVFVNLIKRAHITCCNTYEAYSSIS